MAQYLRRRVETPERAGRLGSQFAAHRPDVSALWHSRQTGQTEPMTVPTAAINQGQSNFTRRSFAAFCPDKRLGVRHFYKVPGH